MGVEFRAFVNKTCLAFKTQELSRETEARKHRLLKKIQQRSESQGTNQNGDSEADMAKADRRRPKPFSLQRYTFHALGDYADTIRRFGTTDSFSTEPVSNTGLCFYIPTLYSTCPQCREN